MQGVLEGITCHHKEDGEKAYGIGKSGNHHYNLNWHSLCLPEMRVLLQYLSKTFSLDYSICHLNMYLLAPKKNVLDKEFECPCLSMATKNCNQAKSSYLNKTH